MKKGFKRLTTILASAMLVASMSLTAFAAEKIGKEYYINGKNTTYSYSTAKAIDASEFYMTHDVYGKLETNVFKIAKYVDKISVGKVIATIKGKLENQSLQTIRVQDGNYNNITKNPIVAEPTMIGKTRYTLIRVSDNNLFRDFATVTKVSTRYCGNYKYVVTVKYDIPEFHVLNGYEVKLGSFTAESVNNSYMGDVLYCTSENDKTVGTAEFKIDVNDIGKTLKLTMNGMEVDTIRIPRSE